MGELDYAAECGVDPPRSKRTTTYDLAQKLKHFERMVNSVRGGAYNGGCRADSLAITWQPTQYRLDYANGGVRVETLDESHIVSPRLTRRGLADWFDAALRALEEVTRG